MKPRIKLAICNFWKEFNTQDNNFLRLLRRRFDIELCDDPDFVFYSVFGPPEYLKYRCTRIFYSGENVRPDFGECDYAFTFDYNRHPRHFRMPGYGDFEKVLPKLIKNLDRPADPLAGKTRFCNFIYSNPYCPTRNKFFQLLSKYKQVDAGGKLFNNLGYRVGDKFEFQRQYKFTIAFENSSHPGYCTEKISEPMTVGSLPIYWGDPLVHRDFNPRSFISFYDHRSLKRLVEHVIEVDQNDELYAQYHRQPWFHNNQVPDDVNPDKILDRFGEIFAGGHPPIAQRQGVMRTCFIRPYARIRKAIRQELQSIGRRLRRKLTPDLEKSMKNPPPIRHSA